MALHGELGPLLTQIQDAPVPQQRSGINIDALMVMIGGIMDDSVTAEEVLATAAKINVQNATAKARTAILGQQALQGKLDSVIAVRDSRNRNAAAEQQRTLRRQEIIRGELSAKFQNRQLEAETGTLEAEFSAAKLRLEALPDIILQGSTQASADARKAVANADIAETTSENLQKKIDAALASEQAATGAAVLTGKAAQARIKQSEASTEQTKLQNKLLQGEIDTIDPFSQDPVLSILARLDKIKNDDIREIATTRAFEVYKNKDIPNSLKTASAMLSVHLNEITHNSKYGTFNADSKITGMNKDGEKLFRKRVVNYLSDPRVLDKVIGGLEIENFEPFSSLAAWLLSIETDDLPNVDADLFQEIIKEYKRLGGKRDVSNTGIAPQPIDPSIWENLLKIAGFTAAVSATGFTVGLPFAAGAGLATGKIPIPERAPPPENIFGFFKDSTPPPTGQEQLNIFNEAFNGNR